MSVHLLGRKPRLFRQSVPHLSSTRLITPFTQPAIPAAENYFAKFPEDIGMMLNDQLGCCTIDGLYNFARTVIFATTGKLLFIPDSCVLQAYEEACGYNPADPSTDQGGIEQNVLAWAMNTGLPMPDGSRHKIGPYGEIDPRNLDDVKRVIAECGYCYIGINCLNSWTQAPPGSILDWDDSGFAGGHCVGLGGYDEQSMFDVATWGSGRYRMTPYAFQRVTDEAYYIIDSSFVAATGKTPFGLSMSIWEQSMEAEQMLRRAA